MRAGTFGPDLEAALGAVGDGYTLGHWPQSMDLSTVGGWLACRGAGQYSTRYGKIEDMVIGLEVVLADGRVVHTEGKGPRAATGPNLTQLFVGSEGTLGVITEARLRIHPLPPAQERRAFGFATFAAGLEACRRILRRGATPAVLRLYDETESERNFEQPDTNVLIVLDEADPEPLAATMAVVDDECAPGAGAHPLETALVERWLGHRNDVSALAPLWRAGIVVDTAEVSGPWAALPGPLRRGGRRAQGHRRDTGRVGPPVPRLHRRRLPLLHLRRARPRGRRRLARALLPPGLGRGHRRHAGARRRHQPSPRHRAEPLPLPAAGPRLGLRGAPGPQGDVRPRTASSTPASSGWPRPSGPRPGR